MIRYYFNTNSDIVLTNDDDIHVTQGRNPDTQKPFMSKEEAIVWATEYVQEYSETLVESEAPIVQVDDLDSIKGDINNLKVEVDGQKALINSIGDAVVELSMI